MPSDQMMLSAGMPGLNHSRPVAKSPRGPVADLGRTGFNQRLM